MLINADFKGLEWLGAVFLSKDDIGYSEIARGIDQHGENQRTLNLPSRLIAKTFVFRLIYGGSAYAYAHDAEFESVSTSEGFWQDVIDKFYLKYKGLRRWHDQLMETAMSEGKIIIPTGRTFRFSREFGKWPRTKILNYPVQGLGADLMMLARLGLSTLLKDMPGILQVSTIHDSIVIDAPTADVTMIVKKIFQTWEELPLRFEKEFGVAFGLPCKVEVKVGNNLKEMEEVHADSNDRGK